MDKRFLVVGSWIDKSSGKPVTRLAEINSGVNKNGQHYELADTDGGEVIDGTYEVGTILRATLTFTGPAPQEGQKELKLATSK